MVAVAFRLTLVVSVLAAALTAVEAGESLRIRHPSNAAAVAGRRFNAKKVASTE